MSGSPGITFYAARISNWPATTECPRWRRRRCGPLSEITFDSQPFQWALHTTATTYAFRWDGAALRHLHWGQRLTADQVRAIAGRPAARWLDGDGGDEELAVEGGARFGPAGLRARFADGTRGLELDYVGTEISGLELQIRFRDRHFPLRVDLHYRLFDDSDVIERSLTLRHTGESDPIALLRADSACWVLPERPDWRLSHAIGGWGAENRLQRIRLPYAETVLTSRRGVSSHQASPWLMLDDGTATEEDRPGLVGGAGLVGLLADHGGTHTREPGQRHRRIRPRRHPANPPAPRDALDPRIPGPLHRGRLRRRLPRLARPYPSARTSAADRGPPGAVQLLGGHRIRHQRAAADGTRRPRRVLGAELFVVDDGWFGERNNEAAGLGDWWVSRDRFPRRSAPADRGSPRG